MHGYLEVVQSCHFGVNRLPIPFMLVTGAGFILRNLSRGALTLL